MKKVLAIDFGASSGRAIIGELIDGKIQLTEIHRFSNDPVILSGEYGSVQHWDFLRLFHEIKQSLIKAKEYGEIASIAIDTWGVDFGFVNKDGRLLENPVHYRDGRTSGMAEYSKAFISPELLYQKTGIQQMEINTLFQLLSVIKNRPELINAADKILPMPNLFSYFLGAEKAAELSIASTTQLMNAETKKWDNDIIKAVGIPERLLPEIVMPGTVIGKISQQICEELDISPAEIIAVCGHDTQSALVAVPASEDSFAFLSCGTWSLLGTELNHPVINEYSTELNLSNETGYGNKTSLLKNIIGLWLIQESRRQWQREGKSYSFAQLEDFAKAAEGHKCYIDPDCPDFIPAGDIPGRIREYCHRTGQYIPETPGEILRCIYQSLAMKYRCAIEQLEKCTGEKFKKLYMVGGGTKDKFLSELAADAIGIPVSVGPVEATAFGNVAVQLIAAGEISDISTARQIIAASEPPVLFSPADTELWDRQYPVYLDITGKGNANA